MFLEDVRRSVSLTVGIGVSTSVGVDGILACDATRLAIISLISCIYSLSCAIQSRGSLVYTAAKPTIVVYLVAILDSRPSLS